jgi:hypothetical protein
MDNLKGISRSKAFEDLFGIKLSDCNNFKNKLTTLEDNGSLKIHKTVATGSLDSRSSRSYLPENLYLLHNVVLMSAIYPKPTVIQEIVSSSIKRQECAKDIKALINGRNDVAGIHLIPSKLVSFLDGLSSGKELGEFKLVNPFKVLPQTIKSEVNGYLSVLEAFQQSSVAVSDFERMMAFYLDREIEDAYELALTMQNLDGIQKQYLDLVLMTHKEAKDFDDVFESFFD